MKTRVSDLLLEECPRPVAPQAPPTLTESQIKRKLLSRVSDSCDPMDCSLPDFSVHGILQARILQWVAISFYRGLSDSGFKPGLPALQADSLLSEPPGCKKKIVM